MNEHHSNRMRCAPYLARGYCLKCYWPIAIYDIRTAATAAATAEAAATEQKSISVYIIR